MGTLTVPRNPQRLSASNHVKTKDNLRPPLMCGLNQWIGGRPATELLSKDEVRKIASNIAKLPELLTRSSRCIMKQGDLLSEPTHAA